MDLPKTQTGIYTKIPPISYYIWNNLVSMGRVISMIHVEPITMDGMTVIGIEVKLPKTNLVMITTNKGYIMCGALDVELLNTRLKERGIIAGRATGVRTWEDLLESPLSDVTTEAEKLGIHAGMKGKDALKLMM